MSYYHRVIKDHPVAFYTFDEPGVTATDFSGYNRDATLSTALVAGRNPIVSDTNGGMKLEVGDSIDYPVMPVWDGGQNSTEFTVEFWLYDYGNTTATLFAPTDSDGALVGVGIFLEDGRITFRVGDATGLVESTTYIETSHQILDIDSAHQIVVKYRLRSISISIDGVSYISFQEQEMSQNLWGHELTGFTTNVDSGEGIMLNCLSVYQKSLSDINAQEHYLIGSNTLPIQEVISRKGGSLVPLNGYGEVSYEWRQPKLRGEWFPTEQYNTFDKNDTTLSLRKISPPRLNTGTETYIDSKLVLDSDQYVIIKDSHLALANKKGAVSGEFYVDSSIHLEDETYMLFNIINIEDSIGVFIVDQQIVVRHSYSDRFGTLTQEDTTYGPATLDATNKIFFMWVNSLITIYVDDFLSPVQYNTSQNKRFNFSMDSETWVGQSFNSPISNFNLWSKLPDVELDFDEQIESVVNYTLPLTNSLNVSQYGYAMFFVDTDGVDACSEVKISHYPVCSNISISQSIDNETYQLVNDNGDLLDFSSGDVVSDISTEFYIKVELSTEDSYLDLPALGLLSISFVERSTNISQISNYVAVPLNDFRTNYLHRPIISKDQKGGINIKNSGVIKILSPSYEVRESDLPITPSIPHDTIKSIEFFIKQNEAASNSKHFFSNSGGETFSLSTVSNVIQVDGFESCWINKNEVGPGDTGEEFLLEEWNHVVLTVPDNAGFNRENLVTNPRLGVDSTGWSGYSGTTGARTTDETIFGVNAYEFSPTSTSTTGSFGISVGVGTGGYPVQAGNDYSGLIYVKSSSEERQATVALNFYDSSGVSVGEQVSIDLTDYPWYTPFGITGTAPTGAEYAGLDVTYAPGVPSGESHFASNAMIEQSSILYPYFDGETDGASWSGTEDNSISLYDIGILISGEDMAFIGNESEAPAENESFSYQALSFYRIKLDQDDIDSIYSSWYGYNITTVSDEGLQYDDIIYSLPIDISGLEDEGPKIEDLEALAVSAEWSTYS